MKKMFEEIEELLPDMELSLYNENLTKALNDYHAMISEGKLIPRGNTLSSLQNNIFSYNTSNTNCLESM